MAILLAAGINATQNRVTLTEPLTAAPGDLFRIGNEVVEFGGYGRMAGGRLVDHSRKIVSFGRGVNGTTAATHTATTAVLRVVDGLVSAVGAPDPFVAAGGASAHGDLTGVTANQHHAQLHAAAHAEGEADEITPAAIGAVGNPLTADLDVGAFLIRGADVGDDKGGLIEAEDAEVGFGGGITVTGGASPDGIGGNGTFEGGNGDQGGLAQLQGGHSFGAFDGGYANIEAGSANVDGQQGGNALVTGGSGSVAGTTGGDGILIGGVSQGSGVPARIKAEGTPAVSGDGVLEVTSDGVTFDLKQAAFVANGSTVDQLRDALIAAGLMAAS